MDKDVIDVMLDQETDGLLYDLDLAPEQMRRTKEKLTAEVIKRLHHRNKVEELAEYAHKAWSGWVEYMFEKGSISFAGELIIPKDLAIRWNRQMSTEYKDLPENEKESDRKEARMMLKIMGEV